MRMKEVRKWNTFFTIGMGKMLGARGYVGMHMENIEHAYNMHIDLL
jgi:hypothetical protein